MHKQEHVAEPERASEVRGAATPAGRLIALDWMRGLVMMIMAIDHASRAFNAGHLTTESMAFYQPGAVWDMGQFFTRWVTGICAPTFLFLAGTALVMSTEKRLAAGASPRAIDRHLFTRGAILVLLDPLWWSPAYFPSGVMLQVLYALGMSLMCMTFLRRLSTRWLVGLALGWLVLGEAVVGLTLYLGGGPVLPGALFFTPGFFFNERLLIIYPFVPWLSIMMLGWAFGRYLLRTREQQHSLAAVQRLLLAGGVGSLGIFAAVRGVNSYGNMRLFRDSGSLQQWLHVSKYPPSLAFAALWLGVMALVLWGFFHLQQRVRRPSQANPLLVFGQTALFFYLAHAYLLIFPARLTGVEEQMGLTATYVSTAAVLALLYPCCLWYRRYKAAHPRGWVQFV